MPRATRLTSLVPATIMVTIVVALAATSCVPADSRPTLGTAPVDTLSHEPTGNPNVDELLARLDAVGGQTFTADYSVERKLGQLQRIAHVAQAPPHTVVKVGDVALYSDPPAQTCDTATSTCEDGLLEQRISDMGISSRFYGPATAQQLRVAVSREENPPTLDTQEIAGVVAQCLHVPVGGGEETYCVTGTGLVALLDTAAMHIELTSYAPAAAPDEFNRPGQASSTASS